MKTQSGAAATAATQALSGAACANGIKHGQRGIDFEFGIKNASMFHGKSRNHVTILTRTRDWPIATYHFSNRSIFDILSAHEQ
ncbi:MAG: hypothetical protein ACOX9C_04225 [Kiritimatiellia bacterium]|jgi:hypothetical protein